jgi:hypothetical protein
MYSHLLYSLHVVAMFCCSEDEEYVDEAFYCLVLSGHVMSFCNMIRYNKDIINILFLHSDHMYDNLIVSIYTMSI